MSGRVQIWLRLDQAECAVAALDYVIARFNGNCHQSDQPAVRLAGKLAAERAQEVANLINEAIARVKPGA